jgi:hypothetical protein
MHSGGGESNGQDQRDEWQPIVGLSRRINDLQMGVPSQLIEFDDVNHIFFCFMKVLFISEGWSNIYFF